MSIINIDLPDDKKLTIENKPKKPVPPYLCIGRLYVSKNKSEGFDTAELLKNLSPAATWLFWTMDQQRDRFTNKVRLSLLNAAEMKKAQRGAKELINQNVVIHLSRTQGYLINPKVLLPHFDNYQSVLDSWLQVGGK